MARDRPRGRRRGDDNLAEPGMGMDERSARSDDQEVDLRGTGLHEQHVTRADRAPCSGEAGQLGAGQLGSKIRLPHRVASHRRGRSSDCIERRADEPDAIETGFWVAPAKPERNADKALRGCGELQAGARHADPAG